MEKPKKGVFYVLKHGNEPGKCRIWCFLYVFSFESLVAKGRMIVSKKGVLFRLDKERKSRAEKENQIWER